MLSIDRPVITCSKDCYFFIESLSRCTVYPDLVTELPECYTKVKVGKPCKFGLDEFGLLRNKKSASLENYREQVIGEVNAYLKTFQHKNLSESTTASNK